MHKQRGFSLIELLIVVAIILVIAAIAIPNLMTARARANESSAVATLRTVNTAQTTYQIWYGGYADSMTKLGGNPNAPTPNAAGLVDWVLGCAAQPCPKSGYDFQIVPAPGVPVSTYQLWATPQSTQMGKRSFCSDQLSVITVDPLAGNPPNCTIPLQ